MPTAKNQSAHFSTAIKAALVTSVASVALLGLAPAAVANPLPSEPPGQLPPPSYTDAAASPDWVPTPPGLVFRSCIHEVPDGAFISEGGVVSVDDVVIAATPPCPYSGAVPVPRSPQAEAALEQAALNGEQNHGASAAKDGSIPRSDKAAQALDDAATNGVKAHGAGSAANAAASQAPIPWNFVSGWWLSSRWTASAPITSLRAQWIVPANPTKTIAGELIYLFPALQPSWNGGGILQPVLQWSANPIGTGPTWVLAGWYGDSRGNYYHSPYFSTSAGHTIQGTIYLASGTTSSFTMTIWDMNTGKAATYWASTGSSSWRGVAGGALEVYGIQTCAQLPNGSITFNGLAVTTAAGKVTPSFPASATAPCYGTMTASSTSTKLSWSTTA